MYGITVFCGLGLASSLSPAADRIAGGIFAGLGGLVVLGLLVGAVRRELRIRRRLAAIQPLTPAEAERRRHQLIGGGRR
jgi:hypothetical protein